MSRSNSLSGVKQLNNGVMTALMYQECCIIDRTPVLLTVTITPQRCQI